jgi:3-hydroxyisobutyrate dehydrogenase
LQTVLFIGLGIMGGAMAANISRAGLKVSGWNRTPGRPGAQAAADAGVTIVEDLHAAVPTADFVILCLSDVADLEQMLFGEKGIARSIKQGAVVIDMSTTGPECAQEVYSKLKEHDVHFLDAPVSGGDVGARNGTLTIMVGGDRAIFDRALPVFETMGKNIRHCGESGAGQAVKLCNQILCAVNMVAVCEAFSLAEQMNIDPNLVVEVCGTGAAGSWALSNLGPRILRGDYGPGFMIKHMLKDLHLAESAGGSSDKLPGTALAEQRFTDICESEAKGDELGTQAMMLTYSRLTPA